MFDLNVMRVRAQVLFEMRSELREGSFEEVLDRWHCVYL